MTNTYCVTLGKRRKKQLCCEHCENAFTQKHKLIISCEKPRKKKKKNDIINEKLLTRSSALRKHALKVDNVIKQIHQESI